MDNSLGLVVDRGVVGYGMVCHPLIKDNIGGRYKRLPANVWLHKGASGMRMKLLKIILFALAVLLSLGMQAQFP